MIDLLLTLLYIPELDKPNPTPKEKAKYEVLTLKREGLTQLGRLTTTTCRAKMTTVGECTPFVVATFNTMESGSEFTICFKTDRTYTQILNADEDIRLVHLNGFFYIMGETINVGYDGSRGVRASTLVTITDCNPKN